MDAVDITKEAPAEEVNAEQMTMDVFKKWAFYEVAVAAAFGDEIRARRTLEYIITAALNNDNFGVNRERMCKKHPKYEIKNKPKADCAECMALWVLKNSEDIINRE
jgi:hypothetical protein